MGENFSQDAYHKAGSVEIKNAIQNQSFRVNTNKKHWLGTGIYFWAQWTDAVWWDGGYDDPEIVMVRLECPKECFLDLDDASELEDFQEIAKKLYSPVDEYAIDFLEVPGIYHAYCNYLKRSKGYRLIRYSFPDINNKTQLCATDNSVVHNVRYARKQQT